MQRRLFSGISFLLLVLGATGLSSCGGGGDDNSGGNASVRFVNVASGYTSLDVYKSSDTKLATAVAVDQAGDYAALAAGTYTLQLKRAGSVATSSTTSRTVYQDTSYTLLAYSARDSLRTLMLNDGEAAPTSGTTKFRVINLSPEAGSLDVFVTLASTSLDGVSANVAALAGEQVSTYSEIDTGTYRIRVTGAGDKSDLRLDIPSVTLANGQILSLVLTSTPGGVLVHGNTLLQKGAVTANKNTSARIRLVSGVGSQGVVAASFNGTSLSTGLKAPAVGTYLLVNAGTAVPDVSVNGTAATTAPVTLVPGGEATLAVLGDPAAPQVFTLTDDNSQPLVSSNSKVRLVNGVQGLTGNITLTVDFGVVASEVVFGTASVPANVAAGLDYRLEATGTTSLYLDTELDLLAGRNYTLFMLGNATSPVGVFRRDR